MSNPEPTEASKISTVLHSISDLAAPLERDAILQQAGRLAAESIGADLGFTGLADGAGQLRATGVHGGQAGSVDKLEVERGKGLGGKVYALGKPALVDDYTTSDSITHEYDSEISAEGLRGMLCLPLVLDGSFVGVTYVSDRVPTHYSDVMIDRVMTAVESTKLALSMAARSRELTEAAIEVERKRTVDVLDASMRDHLTAILVIAQSIAADPTSSVDLVAKASSIMTTADDASVLFGDSASELLGKPVFHPRLPVDDFGLTPRELQVVQLAARGLSNPEIAAELFLARGTVKAYMEASLQKLRARNRVEAVMIAARSGLLDGI